MHAHIYTSVHLCVVCVCVCTSMNAHRKVRGQPWGSVPQEPFILFCEARSLIAWGSLMRLDWLVKEIQGSTCLSSQHWDCKCVPLCAAFSHGFWGSSTVFMLRYFCISSARILLFLKMTTEWQLGKTNLSRIFTKLRRISPYLLNEHQTQCWFMGTLAN